jgi:hypothetical protein
MRACSERWPPIRSISRSVPARHGLHRQGLADQAVAAMASPPLLLAIVARTGQDRRRSPKGKKVSVSTASSLTYWLVSETSKQGWGLAASIRAWAGCGADRPLSAATSWADHDLGNALDLEQNKEGGSSCVSATSRTSTSMSSSPPIR